MVSLEAWVKAGYLSDNADIRGARPVVRSHSVNDPDDVPLHHPHVVLMAVLTRQLQELLDEVHDVCPRIHIAALVPHVSVSLRLLPKRHDDIIKCERFKYAYVPAPAAPRCTSGGPRPCPCI